MKTTANTKSLLADAFEVLLKNLGPQKTTRVWRILAAPQGDYLMEREKMFAGKDIRTLHKEAKKFNRE